MKLKQLTTIKTNFPQADFWLVRRGTKEEVGRPVRTFSQYHIGIKVEAVEILLPEYLYYAVTHIHAKGFFEQIAKGTLSLQHITVEDVKNITIG